MLHACIVVAFVKIDWDGKWSWSFVVLFSSIQPRGFCVHPSKTNETDCVPRSRQTGNNNKSPQHVAAAPDEE